MSGFKSAEESRLQLIAGMGQELGELFDALSSELTWMHCQWHQFRVLFGAKESRTELLNDAAPVFFRAVQDVFFAETVLAIARMVDPPATAGKTNLSVTRLPALLADPATASASASLVAAARKAAEFAVDWRYRHIAHRDLSLALGAPVAPLHPASRQSVEQALEALRKVLNHTHAAMMDTTTLYERSSRVGDAEQLLGVLRDGLLRQADRRSAWEKGLLHADDASPPGEP